MSIDYRKLETHPLALKYKSLPVAEFQALVNNMRVNGYSTAHKMVLFQGKILAGCHRYKAAIEVGIKLDETHFLTYGGSAEDAAAYVDTENWFRRQITPEEKRDRIRQEIERDLNASDRSIAEKLGVSPTTVGLVRSLTGPGVQAGHVTETKEGVQDGHPNKSEEVAAGNPAEGQADNPPQTSRKVKGRDNKTYTVSPKGAAKKTPKQEAGPRKSRSLVRDEGVVHVAAMLKGDLVAGVQDFLRLAKPLGLDKIPDTTKHKLADQFSDMLNLKSGLVLDNSGANGPIPEGLRNLSIEPPPSPDRPAIATAAFDALAPDDRVEFLEAAFLKLEDEDAIEFLAVQFNNLTPDHQEALYQMWGAMSAEKVKAKEAAHSE